MSGDRTDDPRSPGDEAPAGETASTDAAESVVPAFDVPAAETVELPDAETAAADFDVPPPPSFDSPSAPANGNRRSESRSTESVIAERVASSRAALRAAAANDASTPTSPAPPAGQDNTYRVWPIVIFVGLALVLIAAVIWIVILANTAPLPFFALDRVPGASALASAT